MTVNARLTAEKCLCLIRHRDNRCILRHLEPATCQIGRRDTSQDIRVEDRDRNQVFLGL
jgi:hypothetical protein